MAQNIGPDCLWFAFGTGTTFRYLDATAQALGDAKGGGLSPFNALNGCDVSYVIRSGRENVPPGQHGMHMMMPGQLCVALSRMPTTESVMNVLPINCDGLIVITYPPGSAESSVNGERMVLFTVSLAPSPSTMMDSLTFLPAELVGEVL